jgi:hypothetical protein
MPLRHEISGAGMQRDTPSNVNCAPFKLKFDATREYLSVLKKRPAARAADFSTERCQLYGSQYSLPGALAARAFLRGIRVSSG